MSENPEKTDLEKFVELYKSFGIECIVEKTNEEEQTITLHADDHDEDDSVTSSNKFEGFLGFHSTVAFDKDGKFLNQGFWE